jgi:hypothetical protein
MKRKGLGYGMGKGYKNIIPKFDSYVHSLSAKGISLKQPNVTLLNPKMYDKKFKDDYESNEEGYATTKIKEDGSVDIFVKYYPDDMGKTGKLIHHEFAELDIWENLVENGMNPDFAEEVAHNKNPVKIDGVEETYQLDYSIDESGNTLNAKQIVYWSGKKPHLNPTVIPSFFRRKSPERKLFEKIDIFEHVEHQMKLLREAIEEPTGELNRAIGKMVINLRLASNLDVIGD